MNIKQITSTKKEVLKLYKDILKTSRFFQYPNEKGKLWL